MRELARVACVESWGKICARVSAAGGLLFLICFLVAWGFGVEADGGWWVVGGGWWMLNGRRDGEGERR